MNSKKESQQFKKITRADLQNFSSALIFITVLALGYSTYTLWNVVGLTYHSAEATAVYVGSCGSFYGSQYQFSDQKGEIFKPCLSTLISTPQEVKVFYDPQNPNDTADVADWILAIFFALVGAACGISVFLMKRSKRFTILRS